MTPVHDPLFAFAPDALLELGERHSTPCFVYDLSVAAERFDRLRAALPGRVDLAYAVKANPGLPLLQTFAARGAWFDCASAGEVARVLGAGGAGEQMVMAGPAKSLDDLGAALGAGARVQVDGIEDVERLAGLHRDPDRPLPVSVRVNPRAAIAEASGIIGGAGPSAFGVDEEDLPAFLDAAGRHPRIRVSGLQVFAASNELSAQALLANYEVALAIGRRMTREHGVQLDLIDLGGGLGIPYAAGEPEVDLAALGGGLTAALDRHDWFDGRLLVEPGRWLAGPCGVYLTRVVRVKPSRGSTFATLQGGINHLLRPLLTGQSFPVCAPTPGAAAGNGEQTAYTLAGPLCTSLDRLGEATLRPLQHGDLLAFGQAGAYGFTQAMTHFLSHPVPAEHWLP